MGTGPDHSLIDVYIDGSLWQSYDCYSETVSERDITLPRGNLMEIRNRTARNLQSGGTVIRFKQLATYNLSFDETVIDYTYDALSRLLQADYDNGTTVYNYGYDVAGNLVNNNSVSRTYNAVNQMTHDGTNTLTYDSNGNLTSDGTTALSWDRANRMTAHNNLLLFDYDGDGNRVRQIVADGLPIITDYLNDVQPELTKLLAQTTGANTEHFIHAPRGIHAVDDGTAWNWYAQDGLGSVRGLIDDSALMQSSVNYDAYGNPDTPTEGFAFTGEMRNGALQYHRARYYSPELSVWLSEDILETSNRYGYVEGDPVNRTDASGKCWSNSGASASQQSQCYDAWQGYMNVITDTYTSNWPYDIRILVGQEAGYWSQLPYPEFVTQWNGSRPPNQTNPGQSLQDSATFLGGVAAWNGPTPEDWLWIIGGVCLLAAAAAAQAGSVSLPGRQSYNFAESQDQSDTDDDAIPIPYVGPQDPPDDSATTSVYRVQTPSHSETVTGTSDERIQIAPPRSGMINIPVKTQMLFVFLRNIDAAFRYMNDKRGGKGVYIIAFDIFENTAKSIEDTAVEQHKAKTCRRCPQKSDHSRYGPYGYGLPWPWIDALEAAAIPGTGRIEYTRH